GSVTDREFPYRAGRSPAGLQRRSPLLDIPGQQLGGRPLLIGSPQPEAGKGMSVAKYGRSLAAVGALLLGAATALLGTCGPFTDVAADVFCPFVLEIFYLGITTGTTATTYDPASNVSRLQMAAFLSRTVDGVLKRGSRRAILDQFWTTQNST